jgi:hypothetical protein
MANEVARKAHARALVRKTDHGGGTTHEESAGHALVNDRDAWTTHGESAGEDPNENGSRVHAWVTY